MPWQRVCWNSKQWSIHRWGLQRNYYCGTGTAQDTGLSILVYSDMWNRNMDLGQTDKRQLWAGFIHSIGMCRMWRFLAILRSFFHSSLLCTFSCHPSPPTILPSSLTSSCHLFRCLPLNPSILCTCPNQCNLLKRIVPIIVILASIYLLVNILQFLFSLSYTGPKILLYTFLSKMFNCFLSLFF